uniref:H(+)-transporting two-sector ATPase n=1 Tax=Codonopsis lanceolata TaxID=103999 RepID=A0A2U8XH62_9ASTR|nr:Atp8 [Codonopsis lanceolata]AWN57626.1 Atp8 [Codonopsis lanceolata]
MPQLDKFTYFTQFFWLCLSLFTFYIAICNDGDGILGISRILKLRNQLLSHRENKIQSKDPNGLEDILRKGFSTGLSYMYSTLFEVSQWCQGRDPLVELKRELQNNSYFCSFGEMSAGERMQEHLLYLLLVPSCASPMPGWVKTCRNDLMLMHILHGQGSIAL